MESQENSQDAIIDQIYKKINEVFNAGDSQLFCMEFPGRVLNEQTYSYPIDSIYSTMLKPQTVLEEEFRLSDDLFDVAEVTGGPNGDRLSTSYEEALNLLVPQYQSMPKFENDKTKLRGWLLELSEEIIDEKPIKCSRIQLYQILNNRYLNAKAQWEKDKNDNLAKAKASGDSLALENYSRWLANEASVREGQLEALFSDLVVRGYYHEVRMFLGYLDTSSPSEEIEQAKARLRASGMSSLDESETVYPVQFQPIDWFNGLSTDFQPEDLLLTPLVLEEKLTEKENQLSGLEGQLLSMLAAHTGDEKALQAQVDKAQQDCDNAQTEMLQNFTRAIVTAAQIYFAHKNKSGDTPKKDELNEKLSNDKAGGPLSQEEWDKLTAIQNKAISAQQQLTTSSRVLAELMAQKAAAEATDLQQAIIAIKIKINSLRSEIETLKAEIIHLYDKGVDGKDTGKSLPMFPSSMPPVGKFFDITMSFNSDIVYESSKLTSGSSHSSWSVSLFFGSAGGSSDSSWSDLQSKHTQHNVSIDLAFRATKVTINRGGWFSPEIFKSTKSMSSLEPKNRISFGTSKDENLNAGILPAYPVSFIIAKDVTIKYKMSSEDVQTAKSVLNKSSSIGGGFLCFSASHSESSNSTSQSFYCDEESSGLSIKIPGPQILGWYLEYVPEDQSIGYVSMPDGFLP